MRTRSVRSTGVELTEIGLGGATLGNLYTALSDADAAATLLAARDAGIGYVDTAPHYGLGLSERRIGVGLATWPGVVVSTKVGRLLVPDPTRAGDRDDEGFDVPADHRRVHDYSRDGVLRSLEASLARLGTDHVDVVLVHDPDDHVDQAADEALPALVELREQGVVRAVGVGMNHADPLAELVRRVDVDVVMVAGRYTLLEQPAAAALLPLAQERGVGVVVAGVYNSGLLARDRPPADAPYDYAAAPPELLARARRLADVCTEHGTTLPRAALAFALAHPAVVSVVVGARGAGEVRQTLERYADAPPAELWPALHRAGLLDDHHAVPVTARSR